MRKREIACYKQFLLFSQCFPQLNIFTAPKLTQKILSFFELVVKFQSVLNLGKHSKKIVPRYIESNTACDRLKRLA